MRRTRLAPSPTGALHLGNARTFLLTWLWARVTQAEVVLRVEDLDGPRTKAGAVEQALDDLAWLGLTHDGPPSFQSTRADAYRAALEQLARAGVIYPCVCTRKEIDAAASAPNEGDEVTYPGTCRGRFRSAEAARAERGREPAWRFRVPDGPQHFDDAVRGPQAVDLTRVGGDFVVWKKGDEAAYQLAVVVDDAAQGVDCVIRGDDLVPSTPRQLLLYRALGLTPPQFAHVPLVRGTDGRRLAKRHGDTRLASYREAGVPAARILGLLAGWSGLGARTPVTAEELRARWDGDWSVVPPADVVFGPADDAWLRGAS